MKKMILSLAICIGLSTITFAQGTTLEKGQPSGSGAAKSAAGPVDLARATLNAHGGEKLRVIKTLVIRGSVDVTSSAINQPLAGGFAMIFSGDKYRLDLTTPVQSLSQAFDGVNTQTSVQGGFELPPINRIGFIMLAKVGDVNFPISALPDAKKKNGFRITSPEGFYTDYLVDEKTGQLKGYESSYDFNGRVATTSVEIDKCRLVEGVLIPEKFSQRFDLGPLTAYANFKAKDIQVNAEISNDVFTLRKQ